jgi:hypothetical protein
MELAIPFLALGGLYIASNQNNRRRDPRENFVNMGANANHLPNTNIQPTNYPVINQKELVDNVNQYVDPNTATDKYFDQNKYEKLQNNSSTVQEVYSLRGDYIARNDFKHNNMVPFYGGKIKGQVFNNDINENVLDNLMGKGSQMISKTEQAPLFKPEDNVQWAHGAPNQSDFYQSRVNPGMNNANVKPFQSENVGPGLNQGYTTKGSGGYNSGLEARNHWLPKTVDELRVATNPKIEYSLENHEGPSYSFVQNRGIEGKVEKYHPDTFFIQTQDRWLTTTGQEKAQALRPVQEVHDTTRLTTTQAYSGIAGPGSDKQATYAPTNYLEPHRIQLATNDVGPSAAMNKGDYKDKDKAQESYTNYNNNRSLLKQPDTIRSGFSRAIGAVISPLMDAFLPTRREEYSDNYRIYGDAGSTVPDSYVMNPNDITPTTIKETTLYTPNSYMGNQVGGGYKTNEQTPIANQRDTTNCSYVGDAGGASTGWGNMNYEAAYNQHNNESKEKAVVSRTNHGNTNIFNQQMNVNVARIDSDRNNPRQWVPSNMPQMPASKQEIGQFSVPQQLQNVGCERIQPDLLNAFRSNPYTQSLTNCA